MKCILQRMYWHRPVNLNKFKKIITRSLTSVKRTQLVLKYRYYFAATPVTAADTVIWKLLCRDTSNCCWYNNMNNSNFSIAWYTVSFPSGKAVHNLQAALIQTPQPWSHRAFFFLSCTWPRVTCLANFPRHDIVLLLCHFKWMNLLVILHDQLFLKKKKTHTQIKVVEKVKKFQPILFLDFFCPSQAYYKKVTLLRIQVCQH